MLRAIVIALLIAAVGSAVGWLFYWNGQETTIHLAKGHDLVFPMAIHILGAIALGASAVLAGLSLRSLGQAFRRVGDKRRHRRQAAADQLRNEGTQRLWSGDIRGAAKVLGQAVRRSPDDLDAALALARSHEEREEWPAALEILESIRASHQGSEIRLLSRIGRLALRTGNTGAATAAFREAVQEQPDSPRLLAEFAHALASEGKYAEAANTAGKCLAQEREPVRQAATRALWLSLRYRAALNEPDAAVALNSLRKMVKDAPEFLPPILELARLLKEAGDRKGADRLYRASLKREVRGVLLERLIVLHTSNGEPEKALPPLRALVRGNLHAAPRLALARSLLASEDYEAMGIELEELSLTATIDTETHLSPERDLLAAELASARELDREAATLFRRAAEGTHHPFSFECRSCQRPAEVWSDSCACGVWGELEWRVGTAELAVPAK